MQEAEPTATGSSVSLWGSIGFEDHTFAGLAVHHHHKWRRELQVADAAVLLDRRLFSQPLPIDEALACIGVDGEVANLKRGEVLEEVTALRRNHAQRCLDGAAAARRERRWGWRADRRQAAARRYETRLQVRRRARR